MDYLIHHQKELSNCQLCPQMQGPPVYGLPNLSKVMLIGQAPGFKEIEVHKPFAWQAGKTLFSWFEKIGLSEQQFRHKVYMSAVCRCYPGKKQKNGKSLSGDRVPDKTEILNCSRWLNNEIKLLSPQLLIPVGKLAINQLLPIKKLDEVVGKTITINIDTHHCEIIALPHPSGVSTWTNTEPGKSLLKDALSLLKMHSCWQQLIQI